MSHATPDRSSLPLKLLLVWAIFIVYGTTIPFEIRSETSGLRISYCVEPAITQPHMILIAGR